MKYYQFSYVPFNPELDACPCPFKPELNPSVSREGGDSTPIPAVGPQ